MKTSRIRYFLEIARTVALAATCTRAKFGAILVKNGDIVSTGYNGSVRGAINCGGDLPCAKDIHDEVHLTSYFYCPAIHAEHNACLNAGRVIGSGSTMFLAKANGDGMSGRPCQGCGRVMIQTDIKDIFYYMKDGSIAHDIVEDWIEDENDSMRKNARVNEIPEEELGIGDIERVDLIITTFRCDTCGVLIPESDYVSYHGLCETCRNKD